MRAVRSHGNLSTELRMIAIFRLHGITGWRRHQKLPGKPDFIFRKARVAVFIDGCFWHSCPKHVRAPASNVEYWAAKLARNLARDRKVNSTLRRAGWTVVRVWEHALGEPARVASRLIRLLAERRLKS